jgi:predicted transcriptional regulator
MTLTLNLSREAERKLQQLAATTGQSPEVYAQGLVEEQLLRRNGQSEDKTWQELCAPIADAVAASDVTDEELKDILTEAQKEVRAEKRSKRHKGSTAE